MTQMAMFVEERKGNYAKRFRAAYRDPNDRDTRSWTGPWRRYEHQARHDVRRFLARKGKRR